MVIDVALLLDLTDDRTPAVTASNQARKGKVMLDAAVFLGVPAVQNALNGADSGSSCLPYQCTM
jgi:hypothetical protein